MRQLILPIVAFWTTGMSACEEGPQPDIYSDMDAIDLSEEDQE